MKYLKTYEESNLEEDNFSKIKEIILRDCKPYLDDLKKLKETKFLHRGMKNRLFFSNIDGISEKITVSKNRLPVDTNRYVNHYINEIFEKKFGLKLRNECVFTIPQHLSNNIYGKCYFMFPIGDYKCYTSFFVSDLFSRLRDTDMIYFYNYLSNGLKILSEENIKEYLKRNNLTIDVQDILDAKKEFDKILDTYKEYDGVTNEFINSFTLANEIMIVCDKYYLIDEKYTDQLINLLK